jgi:hypothetical protein
LTLGFHPPAWAERVLRPYVWHRLHHALAALAALEDRRPRYLTDGAAGTGS